MPLFEFIVKLNIRAEYKVSAVNISTEIFVMQPDLKEFYEENFIPEHVRLLLGLHGVVYPVDLSAFGAEDIKEIEEEIRSGGYEDKVDFNDESNQTMYLGTKIRDIEKFRFTSIDRRKLMAIGAPATSSVAQNIRKKPRSPVTLL